MKAFILLSFLVLGARCSHRVKRIVGGEKAAIPKPLDVSAIKTAQAPSTSQTRAGVGVAATTAKSDVVGENVVEIFEEDRTSRIEGVKEKDGYISFKGIRYAKPPTEKNRFQVTENFFPGNLSQFLGLLKFFFGYFSDQFFRR